MIDVVSHVRPKKRIIFFLIAISFLIAGISIYGFWKISLPGLANINQILPYIFGLLLFIFICSIAIGVGGILLAILGIPILGFQKLAWSTTNLLFPLAIIVGKIFDIDKERVERSYIELNNHLVKQNKPKVEASRILLLTPHCLQLSSCTHKITGHISNCRSCGGCHIGDLKQLSQKYNINFTVVTGGTAARRMIKTIKPKLVIAVACERDLTSGIQDAYPMPVIGILNDRPNGPCFDTKVNLDRVETVLKNVVEA